jgi:hypothetical protein
MMGSRYGFDKIGEVRDYSWNFELIQEAWTREGNSQIRRRRSRDDFFLVLHRYLIQVYISSTEVVLKRKLNMGKHEAKRKEERKHLYP